MQIIFNKYHGTGNDFIIINNRDNIIRPENENIIKDICERHTGIGADGVILVQDNAIHDFELKYFNSDGRESSMCGNGGRCAAAFAQKAGLCKETGTFLAADGLHKFKISNDIVSISLCDTQPPAIINGNHFINTGSPHYIIYVPDCIAVNVYEKGRSIRWSESFAPGGTNVNFVEHSNEGIFVRTYERGVENETLSCGTGVTAAAISSKWEKGMGKYNVKVNTHGGKLTVSFEIGEKVISGIYLHGPATFVFKGIYEF